MRKPFVRTVTRQLPGLAIIRKEQFQVFLESLFQGFLSNRETGFGSPEKISVHPISAGTEKFFVTIVKEIIDPGVFQEASYNRTNGNIF